MGNNLTLKSASCGHLRNCIFQHFRRCFVFSSRECCLTIIHFSQVYSSGTLLFFLKRCSQTHLCGFPLQFHPQWRQSSQVWGPDTEKQSSWRSKWSEVILKRDGRFCHKSYENEILLPCEINTCLQDEVFKVSLSNKADTHALKRHTSQFKSCVPLLSPY